MLSFYHFCTLLDSLFSFRITTVLRLTPVILTQLLLLFSCNSLPHCIWCNVVTLFILPLFKKLHLYVFLSSFPMKFQLPKTHSHLFLLSSSVAPRQCQLWFESSDVYWTCNRYIRSISHNREPLIFLIVVKYT